MKGKNKEIIIAHYLDKLWMLSYFCTFSVFVHFSLLKKTVHEPCPWQGSMDPWSMFCPLPNNFGNYNVDLVQGESLRRMWEREDHYTVFQYFFQSKRNVKMYLWDVIIQTISRAIFNSIFYCSYSRNYLILTSNSLPADVLWGSFVTHLFFPTDRGEEMNSWRTKPKERLRGLLTSKSDFLTFISRLLVNWD